MSQINFVENDENNTPLLSIQYITRKYPFYVWHAAKKYHSVPQLEASQDAEEMKYISLYSSEYLQEAITMIEQQNADG